MTSNIEFRCFEDQRAWSGFVDGELFVDGESAGPVDFVSKNGVLHEALRGLKLMPSDVVLEPFTENEARKYFANAGYPDVVFVYG